MVLLRVWLMRRLAVVLFLVACVRSDETPSCPVQEDLNPCACRTMGIGLHVVCDNLEESDPLLKALQLLRRHPVHNFLLHGLKLADVPLSNDVFRDTGIVRLRIEESELAFSGPAFKGLDASLQALSLMSSRIVCAGGPLQLARLSRLSNLNLKTTSLKRVSDEWLGENVPELRVLVLDEDEIEEIGNHAFARLQRLEKISAFNNRIKVVKRSMFPRPAQFLTEIDLSGNEIAHLPDDIFTDMPALTSVVLSNNKLTTLLESTWRPVWEQLDKVMLFQNGLVCDEELDWVRSRPKPKQLTGLCVAPSNLVGKTLTDVYKT